MGKSLKTWKDARASEKKEIYARTPTVLIWPRRWGASCGVFTKTIQKEFLIMMASGPICIFAVDRTEKECGSCKKPCWPSGYKSSPARKHSFMNNFIVPWNMTTVFIRTTISTKQDATLLPIKPLWWKIILLNVTWRDASSYWGCSSACAGSKNAAILETRVLDFSACCQSVEDEKDFDFRRSTQNHQKRYVPWLWRWSKWKNGSIIERRRSLMQSCEQLWTWTPMLRLFARNRSMMVSSKEHDSTLSKTTGIDYLVPNEAIIKWRTRVTIFSVSVQVVGSIRLDARPALNSNQQRLAETSQTSLAQTIIMEVLALSMACLDTVDIAEARTEENRRLFGDDTQWCIMNMHLNYSWIVLTSEKLVLRMLFSISSRGWSGTKLVTTGKTHSPSQWTPYSAYPCSKI